MVTVLFLWMVTFPKDFYKKYNKQIFLLGFVIRILCFFLPPLWEDDWSRYLWEGNLIRIGKSPYQIAPLNYFKELNLSETEIQILSQINHPDWTTIYSPFVLLYFALFSFGFSGLLLKLSYLVFETASFLFFSKGKFNKPGLLYWIFPVLVKEVYINFHFEILILSLLWIYFSFQREKKIIAANFILGLVIHIKIFSILFLFSTIHKIKFKKWKRSWVNWLPYLFSGFVGFLIFYLIYFIIFPNTTDFGISNLFKFGGNFKFNQYYEPFWRIFGITDLKTFPFLLQLITVSVFFWISIDKEKRLRKFLSTARKLDLYFLFGYMFLTLLPVYNPWYFLILIPVLVISKSQNLSPWILITLPQFSYFTKARLSIGFTYFYEIPDSFLLLEATISLICLLWHFKQIFILLYRISNISNIAPKGNIGYGNRN
ncbi:hypothetical protein [Leptospira soteropolitanensis]|uniref:Uncharacterized protein n=1 Tax=Leptospira soteropolitanensis TaxID=2950025 RepID=A0AAW5VMR3_9LEPT|nr:hypothetical protein [Leptospira soteropolitanensis]MCW7493336.1 hypothetical protein [Leptospira soteropolitanensis]MCW7501132.1 hypothetical protein [Leptospira soteropolitanensis]MCW7523188.1 hypothetical protein [Leptospira soteropolitanensis]MCW7530906.1 hypothetical protein [Leptospira soteropolitanensis]